MKDEAKNFIHSSVVWLCDKYDQGCGLASLEADEYQETLTLLGCQFDFPSVQQSGTSFLASAICDLAAFIDDSDFYANVVNDIKASRIYPIYWQAPDTKGLLHIESEGVIAYPNIQYNDLLSQFSSFEFAEHIAHEPRSFHIAQKMGVICLMFVTLLLRDRYFPTIWPIIIQSRTEI
ncbi:MAG: hypothetical protein IPP13_02710 [Kouleothrix sp.]|nr:hypothetical protein [Kouleothrix sp.]